MRNIIIMLLCLFSMLSQTIKAQQDDDTKEVMISGTVLDENNEPLPGTNVTIKDVPGLGTITDIDGKFRIKVHLFHRLVFSYIGFDSKEVLVKDTKDINVIMKESTTSVLDEVVITGTGAQKKISVTGAITSVSVDNLKSNSSANITNTLAGNVAGIIAMQTSGQPGKNTSEFWIRGISTFGASNSALVLVDGFERDMNDISVEDIESFQVLKDASETAIYGARGANGVVLITTKHGKPGKISVSAKVETSYNTRTITPEYVDGYTYAQLANEARITRNQEPIYQPDELFILKNGLDPDLFANVDWRDIVLKDGAMSYRASLNLNGGGANTRYYVSASYVEDQGMYKTDQTLRNDYNTNANARRWNYRMNADIDITKTTLLNVGISGMLKKLNDAGSGSKAIWNSLFGQNPVDMPVVYSNGYIPATSVSDVRDNPWVAATQTGYRQTWDNQIQTNVTLSQKLDFLTKGLSFKARFGFDTNNHNWINKLKEPERWIAERSRDSNGDLVFKRLNVEKKLEQTSGASGDRREFFEAELHYDRGFNNHHINSTLKYNQDSKVQTVNLGEDLKSSVPYRHQGFAGRFTYNWRYRYYLNFNFGYTGSENFALGKQFGFFPAFSTAWNVAEESFIKNNLKWMNMFKIRYSWGKVGNDNVGIRFPYLSTIGNVTSGVNDQDDPILVYYNWADYGFNRSFSGLSYTNVASTNVTWEIATKHDLGVDLSLFDDRFTLTADYFSERRDGIFMIRNYLPWTVGLLDGDTPKANVGSVSSKGWDGNFAFKQKIGDVNITIRGNATYSINKVLEKDEGFKNYPYQYAEGYRSGQTRGLISLGLFKDWDDIRNSPTQNTWGKVEPGDIKYKDVNGDGVINDDDIVAIGNTDRPGFIYGMGVALQWKGLDANVHFQGAGNSTFFVDGALVKPFTYGNWGNISTDFVNSSRWISEEISGDPSTENPNAKYPRLDYGNSIQNNKQQSTFWMRDGGYLRLKTLEIGYTLPKTIVNRIHFNNVRFFFIGNNLLTFSKFKLWDPELRSHNGAAYPITKSITLGLTVSL